MRFADYNQLGQLYIYRMQGFLRGRLLVQAECPNEHQAQMIIKNIEKLNALRQPFYVG